MGEEKNSGRSGDQTDDSPDEKRAATGTVFPLAREGRIMQEGLIDHVMIRVENLDESVTWYQNHLDFVEHNRHEGDDFTLVFLGPEDVHEAGTLLELTYNHDGRSYEMGDAWGHIAVRVDDLYEAYDGLMDGGVKDYRDPDSCGGNYAFVKDPDGYEIEIVERDHGAQWSIDHTMIRVEDADRSIGWYTRKFGWDEVGRWEADTFANFFMHDPDAPEEAMDLELTYNYDGRSYTMGDAWGHLAVASNDLVEYWERLQEREAADYRDPESCGFNYAFTKDPDGHEIEIVER